jgi:hypothetical protein
MRSVLVLVSVFVTLIHSLNEQLTRSTGLVGLLSQAILICLH